MMHKCDWLSMKFLNTPLMCTKEYIPVVYELRLVGKYREEHEFDGTGKFKNNFLQFYDG